MRCYGKYSHHALREVRRTPFCGMLFYMEWFTIKLMDGVKLCSESFHDISEITEMEVLEPWTYNYVTRNYFELAKTFQWNLDEKENFKITFHVYKCTIFWSLLFSETLQKKISGNTEKKHVLRSCHLREAKARFQLPAFNVLRWAKNHSRWT